jgi:hypothetical protein
MRSRLFQFVLAIAGGVIAMATEADAWGAGIHVSQGSFVLDNLSMIRPHIATVLAANPLDYIYGCISADIFIGKGYKRRDDHCHNWSVGFKVLEGARNDVTRAYAYGYLTHLAADVIAHNHMIPNLLYATLTGKRLGHVYWEFRADRYIQKRFWRLASEVVNRHNLTNDTLIKDVMKDAHLRFGAKKMLFKRAVQTSDVTVWREEVDESNEGARSLSRREVVTLNNYALNLIIDFLRNEVDGIALWYDPVGTDNVVAAKKIRRDHKREHTHGDNGYAFPVPEEIIRLDYLDHETIRF